MYREDSIMRINLQETIKMPRQSKKRNFDILLVTDIANFCLWLSLTLFLWGTILH